MQNKVFKGIPRTFLGRSAFAAPKLVKTAWMPAFWSQFPTPEPLDMASRSRFTCFLKLIAGWSDATPFLKSSQKGRRAWSQVSTFHNEANLMAQVRRVSQGLAFAVKALRNPVELARELYPTRGFKRVSGLDSIAFLDNWQVAKSAVGTNTFRETSHSFTLVLRDFYSDILFKNADDIVELFTTSGVWISCRNVKDLDDAIARD